MSFYCRCGNRIATNQEPSTIHGSFVTDANFDKAVSYAFEDAGRFVGSDIESVSEQMGAAITDAYLENARFVVFCDVCGRLNIQLGPSSAEYLTYLAEPGAIGSPDA